MPRSISRGRPIEEAAPIRRGREIERDGSYDEAADERPRPRHRGDSEDYPRGRNEASLRPSNMSRGRVAVRRHRETRKSGNFAPKFTIDKEEVLIKFVDDDFFLTYYEHWIREFLGQRRQMSFVCLGEDNDCPLCEIGDLPKFTALINVIDLSDPRRPEIKVWYATPNPADVIDELMEDEKTSPVNRDDLYFAVSKKQQKNRFISYKVVPVKARDLEEDWDTEPLTADEIARLAAGRYEEDDCVHITPRRDMQAIADELSSL